MRVKLSILLVITLVSYNALSGPLDIGSAQVGRVQCYEKTTQFAGIQTDGRFCTYTVVNLASVSELQRKVEQALFNGQPLLNPEGILEAFGNNNQTLIFSHQNGTILQRMIEDIPRMDSKEEFAPSDIIKLRADIYEVTETGMSNIGAGITELNIGTGVNDGLDNSRTATIDSNGLGINLRAGSYQISGVLAREKQRGNLKRITQIEGDTYNLDKFDYSDLTVVYTAPGAGTTVKQANKGISLSAKVSINNSDSKTVVLKDLVFYYGIEGSDGRINELKIPKKRLVVREGVMIPLVSSKTIGTSSTSTGGILSFGRETTTENKKLLVYVSVQILPWKEYIKKMTENNPLNINTRFTREEKNKLPSECPSMKEVLSSVETKSFRGMDGDPILSFYLDKQMACKSNLKKRIYVSTQINGNKATSENTQIFRLEELMLKPVRIKNIPSNIFLNEWIEFKTTLAPFTRKSTKGYTTGMIFINSVNPDIQDDLYIENEILEESFEDDDDF